MATVLAVALVSAVPAGPPRADAAAAAPAKTAPVHVTRLTVEGRQEPLGIDAPQPLLSWQLASGVRGERQTAYQVIVSSTAASGSYTFHATR